MTHKFNYIGIKPNSIKPIDINQANIKFWIAEQQEAFENGIGNDPSKIVIHDFTFVASEPEKWLIMAIWSAS